MTECPDYQNDIGLQEENSQLLEVYAAEQGARYVEFTLALRENAQVTNLWAGDDHFSAAGYEFFSDLLAEEIASLIPPL